MKTFEANKHKQSGFTIIELVIVILVIGILSAVALPRMIDLSNQARKSVILAIRGNLSTSVELLRSQWIAEGKQDSVTNMDGQAFYIGKDDTHSGSVKNIGTADILSADVATTDCIDLWNKLLRTPPIASDTANCNTNGTCKFFVELTKSATTGDVCKFTDRDTNYISYNRLTGVVDSSIESVE